MNCEKCGAPISDGDLFCKSCGARVVEPPTLEFVTPDLGQLSASEHKPQAEMRPQEPLSDLESGSYDASDSKRADRDAKRQANAAFKEAKAAYREARKAAGKSVAPKVAAIAIALALAAGAGAAGMWYFGGFRASATFPAVSASNQVNQDSQGSAAAVNMPSSVSAAEPDNVIAKSYLGTWSGDMFDTGSRFSSYRCYGAREYPMELEIGEFESTGRISANAKVLVHAHNVRSLDRDIDSHTGDQVVELKNLIGTYNNGSITFKGDTSKGVEVEIAIETDDSAGSGRRLIATVTASDMIDVYSLTKEA